MTARARRVVALVIVAALVLAGLAAVVASLASGSDPTTTARIVTPTPLDDAPDASLASYYGQHPQWKRCTKGFVCARVRVPMDYTHPEGRQLQIALEMRPASGKRIGAMLINPGGPGGSGLQYVQAATDSFNRSILTHYDLIGFDPRGVGLSDPIHCLSTKQLDAYLSEDPDPDTPAEAQAYADSAVRMGRGCTATSGDLAAHVSTIEAARDMDIMRSALGQPTLNYFGASYGTKLGATYASLFPHKVGRFVLDGALDPKLSTLQINLGQARGFETALRSYVGNCVHQTKSCFLGSSVDAGLAKIRSLVKRIDAKPLRTGSNRRLTEGLAAAGIFTPLYDRSYWLLLSEALKGALHGDGSVLLELADIYSSRGPHGYTDNSQEAIYAISCLDDPWSIPASQVPSMLPQFEKASPTFGRLFAWANVTCSGQVAKSENPPLTISAAGAPPIIVTGTTRDPATPFAWAQSLAHELASGVLIERHGDGHTAYHQGSTCVDKAIDGYLLRGTVPKNGLNCS